MAKRQTEIVFVLAGLALFALAGCRQTPATDLTFERGVQLVAAGSPRLAIPFLTQVITSAPDGPEPHAMLSLAFALDLQGERAILQAAQVRRPAGEPPGWEGLAVGIARMTQGQYPEAVRTLKKLSDTTPPNDPMAVSAAQWLALALLHEGDSEGAVAALEPLAAVGPARTTALLWMVLIQSRGSDAAEAARRLGEAARAVAVPQGPVADVELEDVQVVYDAAVAALASGTPREAERMFSVVQRRSPNSFDAAVWLSLIAAADGDWSVARARLRDACSQGSYRSQGLANHLYGVVCALERKPDATVQVIVVGQTLLGRGSLSRQVAKQPPSDNVWFSDAM
jgi:predicted Zn-dependent protease